MSIKLPRDNIVVCFQNLRALPASFALLLGSLVCAPVLGAVCPTQIDGDRCTAKDLQPTGTSIIAGPSACTQGDTVSLTVRVEFENGGGANNRYDLGFFVGDNGDSTIGGASCTFASLTPQGGAIDLTSGVGPYQDLDGDSCGDLDSSNPTYRDIVLPNTLCKDDDGDGQVDVDFIISWDNNGSSADCSDPNDSTLFEPNPPKCLSSADFDLPVQVEPAPSISVTKVALPAELEAPGGDVTFSIAIHNDSSATDPVTITSLTDAPYGDLNGQGTCTTPIVIAPQHTEACEFTIPISGSPGDSFTDTVTASGTDDEGDSVSDSDSATVDIVNSTSPVGDLQLRKVAMPSTLPEPGGLVRYSVLLYNASSTGVEVTTLDDDLYGDLNGQGSCNVPIRLDATTTPFYICHFSAPVNDVPGAIITDTITAIGSDDNNNPVSASDSASVTITDLNSKLEVTKTPFPALLAEPGGNVTYQVQIQNVSTADEVTLNTLNDNIYGNLDSLGTCSVPQVLAANGGTYQCEFTQAINGSAGDRETDIITASGVDDDGNTVSAIGAATVSIEAATPPVGSIRVIKTPSSTSVYEPGGIITFNVTVFNSSDNADATINTLVDSVHGNLDGQGDCALPVVLPTRSVYRCSFSATVVGRGGEQESNVIVAFGEDETSRTLLGSDVAQVAILNRPATLALTKTASPRIIIAPGQDVTFTIEVTNTSVTNSIDLTSLTDSVYGNLNGRGSCSLPPTIAAGITYSCSFTEYVSGDPYSAHFNLAQIQGVSNDGDVVAANAAAVVAILAAGNGAFALPVYGNWTVALSVVCILLLSIVSLRKRQR
ncbi:hypothetical protein QWI17_06325 [Gilvimarinus sp. SDUM040013]|uniref:DUF11 domain-containing protein n=1 Tax=Gilvimarinus gilvus TaxID=3058038 RepID=A0ABU4S1R3_9GAMM|nr:hypothetical protein [Gilvimarinus sp. SDUM040013]MDO3385454.1 hypothetical protein [Gilvimarinus sp. SDUM040013]MDX6851129.1 hypothetical protein [Gilvimarinus sp. SDUM040013]